MKKILALALVLILVVGFAACAGGETAPAPPSNAPAPPAGTPQETPADEGETIVLRGGFLNPEHHPLIQAIAEFGRILEEETNGRITVEIFAGGTLGDRATHIQSLQTGVLDMHMSMSGVIADFGVPELGVLALPFMFENVEHARAFHASDAGLALFETVQTAGTRMMVLGTYQESSRNFFFTDRRISRVEDMQGVTMRSLEGALPIAVMDALGANPISVDFSELFSALQTGMVDGADQPLSGFYANQFHEVANYFLMSNHETSPNMVLFSEITWNSLTPEDQAIIQEAFNQSILFFNELSDRMDAEFIANIQAAGVEIIELENPEDWRAAVLGVHERFGGDFMEIIEAIRNTSY